MGMVGLETALSVVQMACVETGMLDWAGVADRMAFAPARIGLLTGQGEPLAAGSAANLVLVDPAASRTIEPAGLVSMSRNTPFAGMKLPRRGRRHVPAGQGDRLRRQGGGRVRDDTHGRQHPVTTSPAVLVLEDGRTFHGDAYGAIGETFGEAVFSTGMSGYQETLTDPSYHRQVVVMTAPHIGNTGVNDEDPEVLADLGRRLRRPRPLARRLQLALPPDARRRAARAGRRRHQRDRHAGHSPGICASAARCAPASSRVRLPRPPRTCCSPGCGSPLR